jgi:hypothetical protein
MQESNLPPSCSAPRVSFPSDATQVAFFSIPPALLLLPQKLLLPEMKVSILDFGYFRFLRIFETIPTFNKQILNKFSFLTFGKSKAVAQDWEMNMYGAPP